MAYPHPIGQVLGVKLLHRLHNRRGHGPWQRRLGRGHLKAGEELSGQAEAPQLEGAAAQVHADQLVHQKRKKICSWVCQAPRLSTDPCRLSSSEAL